MSRLVSWSSSTIRMRGGSYMLVRRRSSTSVFTNFGEQCLRAVRLCHVGVAAGGERLGLVTTQCIGGDDDDGDVFQRRIGLDTACSLVAVEKRKLNVHEDHIGVLRGSGAQSLFAVTDLDDLESSMAKEIAKDPPIVLLVLDHQNALCHAFPTCCSTSTGTSRKKVEPAPSSDSTQIRPPCMATIRRAIDRPSPVPPFGLVVELSACWNSSKILV